MYINEDLEKLVEVCFTKATIMMNNGLSSDMDIEQLTTLLFDMEMEKLEKERISDESIDYNDEIVSIEHVGEVDTIDITVTGDQLFYCNGILTKNSMGLPHTVDSLFGLITSEQLQESGQLMIKQLKNRWGDISQFRRFVVGIDRSKMKLYNLDESAQDSIVKDASMDDRKGSKGSINKHIGTNWEDSLDKTDVKKKFDIFDFDE